MDKDKAADKIPSREALIPLPEMNRHEFMRSMRLLQAFDEQKQSISKSRSTSRQLNYRA